MEARFLNPPASARPQTWWHWMNGNITKAGITADLEAMKQIGLGGATIVNVDCDIPAGPVTFMSPEWREHFKFAVQEAGRFELELCVANCAGWSSSGGPWNTAENAMQRVTSSEVRVSGPTKFDAVLPLPPTTLDHYRDIAVLAFPAPPAESVRMRDLAPVITSSAKGQPGGMITDGDLKSIVALPLPSKNLPQYVQVEFREPFTARTVKIVGGKSVGSCVGEILVSDDGKEFRSLKPFVFTFGRNDSTTRSVSLDSPAVPSRYWRLQFTKTDPQAGNIPLAEIDLISKMEIENVETKAGFRVGAVTSAPGPNEPLIGALQRKDVVDLTSVMASDGSLKWQAPAGDWIILRLGHTPTGVNNHPAPKGGLGLECDKLSKSALDAHWNGFMQKVLDDIGPLAGKTLTTALIDSYEVRGQNWNKDFRDEFKKRRGYDLLTFLPAFTGRIVDNPTASERFLWDVRRTIADLFAENYFGHFAKLCREHGLQNAVEPYAGPFDSLQSGAEADVVMGEFWAGSKGYSASSIKIASSIAHIYGKTIVGAESFTVFPEAGRWQNDPYSLKTLGDLMYCKGINRYSFHRYAMQPWTNRSPGMTMGQWGFHFERTLTWWSQGKAWIDYITRCQFLLQQGQAVADAAYFTGELPPPDLRVGTPSLPFGYEYDAVNSDVLLRGATVEDGRIVLPSGANYAMLILQPGEVTITPTMLQRLGRLVRDGATVVGPRPQQAPGLTDFPHSDALVQTLAAELWGKCDGTTVRESRVGKGRIVWGLSPAGIFAEQNLKPDFEFQAGTKTSRLAYTHRVAGETDIYFVSNQNTQAESAECTFRVSGKVPELWNAETATIRKAPLWREQDGRTIVSLAFEPAGSVFVIFREPSHGADHIVAATQISAAKPAASAATLEIRTARYEAVDAAAGKDVTAQLAGLVKDGVLSIAVENTLFSDAAPKQAKQLRVEFALDGRSEVRIVKEHGRLEIAAGAASTKPSFEVLTDEEGRAILSATAACRVEFETAAGKKLAAEVQDVPQPIAVTGPWSVAFPPNWGAPAQVSLPALVSWTEHSDEGVRYFSGTATYTKAIDIPAYRLTGESDLWLDLGAVKNFAEVSLNGEPLVVLWKPPFRANLTSAARPGNNTLEIRITNLWPNRLIGDEQLPPDCEWNGSQLKAWPQWLLDGKPSPPGRFTFTTWHHWKKDDPLLPSGLLGPVTINSVVRALAK